MAYFDGTEMNKFLIFGFAAGVFGAFSAVAQDKSTLFSIGILADKVRVAPVGDLTVFEHRPSRLFGNAFNEELGAIGTSDEFLVTGTKEIGSFGGTQVWVQLAAPDENAGLNSICSGGCWAYLGEKSSEVYEFKPEGKEESLVGYGNFFILKD